jgi:hypothetical protein
MDGQMPEGITQGLVDYAIALPNQRNKVKWCIMTEQFILKDDALINYSPAEREMFTLLSSQPRDSKTIAQLRYSRRQTPYHGRQIVIGVLKSLVRKTKRNREPFRIMHTKRSGPIPMSFWIEAR